MSQAELKKDMCELLLLECAVDFFGYFSEPMMEKTEIDARFKRGIFAAEQLRRAAEELTDKQNASSTITQAFKPSSTSSPAPSDLL
jgi:hypothetical protein